MHNIFSIKYNRKTENGEICHEHRTAFTLIDAFLPETIKNSILLINIIQNII